MTALERRLQKEIADLERATYDSISLYRVDEDDFCKWEGIIR